MAAGCVTLGVLCTGLALAATPGNRLLKVELSEQASPEITRIAIDLAEPAQPTFFMLERPRRAVLDIPATRAPAAGALPKGRGLVKTVRTGPQPKGVLRLVLELDTGTVINWSAPGATDRRIILEAQRSAATVVAPATVVSPAPVISSAAAAAPVVVAPPAAASTLATPPAPVALKPVKTEHAPPAEGRDVIVAIDAGHGGQDPGAIGRGGLREKDVVLDIARELAELINREPGMRAVMTRDGDYFLTLRERIRRARSAGAQLFVSVHADSVRDPSVSGSSVYVLSLKGATDEQSRLLADRENAADLVGGISLDDKDPVIASVLVDLAQSAQISQSMIAAERVLNSLRSVNEVRKPQVQQAGFVVLKSPDIPSMLVETAFISSPADERLLGKPERREALAAAIFAGVKQFFIDHPPDGSRFAKAREAGRTVVATAEEAPASRSGKL